MFTIPIAQLKNKSKFGNHIANSIEFYYLIQEDQKNNIYNK